MDDLATIIRNGLCENLFVERFSYTLAQKIKKNEFLMFGPPHVMESRVDMNTVDSILDSLLGTFLIRFCSNAFCIIQVPSCQRSGLRWRLHGVVERSLLAQGLK